MREKETKYKLMGEGMGRDLMLISWTYQFSPLSLPCSFPFIFLFKLFSFSFSFSKRNIKCSLSFFFLSILFVINVVYFFLEINRTKIVFFSNFYIIILYIFILIILKILWKFVPFSEFWKKIISLKQ